MVEGNTIDVKIRISEYRIAIQSNLRSGVRGRRTKVKESQRSDLAFADHDRAGYFVVQSAMLFLIEYDH